MLQLVARATCVRPLASRCRVVSRAAAPFSAAVSRPEQNAADVRDLLRTRLSLTEAELDKTMRHGARCARAKIEPKLDWLQTRLDLNAAQLGKLVRKDPTLLTKSILSMDSNRDWLQRFLGPDEAHKLRKVVLRCPSALYYSLEDKIEPLLENLSERLDLKNVKQLRKMVVTHPPLLSYSFENKIAPLLQWLQERKEWQGRATTTRLELDDAELRAVITGNPGILGASVEDNLERKLAFFVREAGVSRSELRDHVVKAPGILTRSLNRYRARLEEARRESTPAFVSDTSRAAAALGAVRAGLDAGRAADIVSNQLNTLADAMHTLEVAHQLALIEAAIKALSHRERWEMKATDANSLRPRDWQWLRQQLSATPQQLRDAGLEGAAELEAAARGRVANAIGEEMKGRTKNPGVFLIEKSTKSN